MQKFGEGVRQGQRRQSGRARLNLAQTTATQLAINRQVEQRQIVLAVIDLEFGSD